MKNPKSNSAKREFELRDCKAALAAGFTNPKIVHWARSADRIQIDYKGVDTIYTAIWQHSTINADGKVKNFGGANLIVDWNSDNIWDVNGNPCHNFKTFRDFLYLAMADIQRREERRKEAIARRAQN